MMDPQIASSYLKLYLISPFPHHYIYSYSLAELGYLNKTKTFAA